MDAAGQEAGLQRVHHASQLASITFSDTPIAPQVSVPSDASSSTRVTAPVAFASSRMRTL
jgi:hypothetical protein